MCDALLFFIQGDNIFHLGDLFSEISSVEGGSQNSFINILKL